MIVLHSEPRIGPLPRTCALVMLLCAIGIFLLGRCQPPVPAWSPTAAAKVDTLSGFMFARREAYLRRQLGDSARMLEQLRRRVAGVGVLQPHHVTVYDTLVMAPETVFLTLAMDTRGALQADAGVRVDTSGRVRPETRAYDVSRCDDGWLLAGDGRVVCNRARFGRLEAFGAIGIRTEVDRPLKPPDAWEPAAAAGIRWTPCLRCTTAVELRIEEDGDARLYARKAIRLW